MGLFSGLVKGVSAQISSVAKEKGITSTPVAQGNVIRSRGSGGLFNVAKATGVAKKMNGDTSASSTISSVDRSFKKHKRNNIFGN